MSTTELTVSYDDVEETLKPIGGVPALLAGLPAFLPNIPESTLKLIEDGIVQELPVDIRAEIPGLTYILHLRGAPKPPA